MEFTEDQKKSLRTKALAEYGSALIEFELLYAPGVNIGHKIGENTVRSIGARSYTKRWTIFLIQQAGVKKIIDPEDWGGIPLRHIMGIVNISRSAALYIVNELIEAGLVIKENKPDEFGKKINFYCPTEILMDSYFDFIAYVYTQAKKNDINGVLRKCMAIDDLVGISSKISR
jgi:hypothetical protein